MLSSKSVHWQEDTMNEWAFIGAAYGLSWLVLSGYAVYLYRRHGSARESFRRTARSEGGVQ